ncbi:type VI secretion system TssO [Frigoriflavimonas asaccharolytica]|uniref:Uncharacterized protein n=1 Tax=Frigoriflavimonas asaccharolytica TaxID=2735899 RepID=A0A8J8GAW1_9FLAO|nr:type VI secretion system TssO [Frigoriflavimonas asaccharolytica]NRS93845.1 hypothetical protein [Frigoriflavimonas asaccharolytica]
MQINIALSKKEKRHYFLYLLGLLMITILVISAITLRKYKSPFSGSDLYTVLVLEEKAKFDEAQKSMQKRLDTTFTQIDKLDPQKFGVMEDNNISVGISDIENAFKITTVKDPRSKGYPRIANFYKMYQIDKKNLQTTQENIDLFKIKHANCLSNVKEKSQMMNMQGN